MAEEEAKIKITKNDVSSGATADAEAPEEILQDIKPSAKMSPDVKPPAEKSPDNSEKEPAGVEKQPEIKGPSIMLVDDDELILAMYAKKLESNGFKVHAVNNSSDAAHMAREVKPKIIFLDVVMAGKNGAEVLKEIKADPTIKDIPVVMLTNFSDKPEDIEGAKKTGAHDYLVKAQTDPAALSAYITQLLSGGS